MSVEAIVHALDYYAIERDDRLLLKNALAAGDKQFDQPQVVAVYAKARALTEQKLRGISWSLGIMKLSLVNLCLWILIWFGRSRRQAFELSILLRAIEAYANFFKWREMPMPHHGDIFDNTPLAYKQGLPLSFLLSRLPMIAAI